MKTRDIDYIEARLLAPCTPAMEALGRIRDCGELQLSNDLMQAVQEFQDKCREIRRRATDTYIAKVGGRG